MLDSQTLIRKLETMALRTIRGIAREGFFIPYRYAADVPIVVERYDALEALFREKHDTFQNWISKVDGYAADIAAIDAEFHDGARFDQYWFPRLDAVMTYTMIRSLKPKRIIEVGSGHSTRFMVRAIKDGDLSCTLTAIDPAPRKEIAHLPINFIPTTVQRADEAIFASLEEGDMLCVDSSHILMPGTDVDMMLNRVLPSLPSGVIIFFHDIFLPEPYPAEWQWRGYNEQNAIGGLLQGGYEIVFSCHYAARHMVSEIDKSVISDLPLLNGAHECGLWLKKR